ncbi:MAG: hypothetical protein LBN99_03620 [Oscillospiraceae bacterium]|jgi:hypothetical protein|nr:hypothetical protein [Oscillospiraceae bacterium]
MSYEKLPKKPAGEEWTNENYQKYDHTPTREDLVEFWEARIKHGFQTEEQERRDYVEELLGRKIDWATPSTLK